MVGQDRRYAAGHVDPAGDVEELVGAVGVGERTEHAGDEELRLGKLVAEHLLSRGVRRFGCLLRRRDVPERLVGESIRTAVLEEGGSCELIRVSRQFEDSLKPVVVSEPALNTIPFGTELPAPEFDYAPEITSPAAAEAAS